MQVLSFFLAHPRMLSLGILLTLFSSFGQTFLISIFVPRLLESFALTTAEFGTLYASATLLSAATLPFFGRLIDRISLRRFSFGVGFGLVAACFLLASARSVEVLFLAILGLRLTGQGLLGLTASTTMARSFDTGRGKALSIASLGYPLGEGLLPMLMVLLMHFAGWRLSWAILGAVIAMLLLPALAGLLREHITASHEPEYQPASTARPRLFRDWRFFLLLPVVVYLPFVLTALFLYQLQLAEFRGWTVEIIASAFIGFAVARMLASLFIGSLIDRHNALTLFPLILLPVFIGLSAVSIGSAPWIAYFYLLMAGISQGLSGPLMTSLWVELYGLAAIGSVKSIVSTIGIFATAAGPLVLGWMLSNNAGFEIILPLCAGLALLATGSSLIVSRSARSARHAN